VIDPVRAPQELAVQESRDRFLEIDHLQVNPLTFQRVGNLSIVAHNAIEFDRPALLFQKDVKAASCSIAQGRETYIQMCAAMTLFELEIEFQGELRGFDIRSLEHQFFRVGAEYRGQQKYILIQ